MFQSIYQVKIEGKDIKRFLKKLYNSNIYIEDVDFSEKCVYLKLTKDNYEKLKDIKKIYKIEVVRLYGIVKLIDIMKRHFLFIVALMIGYFYLLFLSNIIFDVNIIHSKKEIRNLIKSELKKYGIEKYKFIKNYKTKEEIEVKILEDNKDKLEWLEIKKNGVKYEVRVEERIINKPKDEQPSRNIVAKKDGILMKIQASKGEVVKKVNEYVKKGDVVISGLITKDEEVKNQVTAEGKIFAEVWYQSSIDMPYYYKEVTKTGKSKKTLKLRFINSEIYLFDFNKYKSYNENKILSFSNQLLPISFSFSKEEETNVKEFLYSPDEAIKEAKKLATDKLSKSFDGDEKIIDSKILKTTEYENYINVVVFYKVYEDITDYGEIVLKDDKENVNS